MFASSFSNAKDLASTHNVQLRLSAGQAVATRAHAQRSSCAMGRANFSCPATNQQPAFQAAVQTTCASPSTSAPYLPS